MSASLALDNTDKQGLDLDELVSISMIRQHLKISDIMTTTDEQLVLYRKAAIESAEHYTGFFIGTRKWITESVLIPPSKIRRPYYRHTLRHPVMDDYVRVSGGLDDTLFVEKDTNVVRLKVSPSGPQFDCCRPCGSSANSGLKIHYYTGFSCISDVPSGVVLGILKYIAWTNNNPGDEITTTLSDFKTTKAALQGSNNAAWASGALELWRQYNRRAV